MAVKLARRARWSRVRARLESENGIKVNFSSAHSTYYSAYEYVTKEDDKFLLSDGHPEQSGPPVQQEPRRAREWPARGKVERKNATRRLMWLRLFVKTSLKVD